MVSTAIPAGEIGQRAPDFSLKGVDGRTWTLAGVKGEDGLVVAFICNHCPYVKAVIDRFVDDARALQANGIGVAAVMPNDWTAYPADAPDKMAEFAEAHGFTFPYLIDEAQVVARAYGAVCTPDIFGFDKNLVLTYRGRVDSAANRPADASTHRELREAMLMIARTGQAPEKQHASIGCSIKWRR